MGYPGLETSGHYRSYELSCQKNTPGSVAGRVWTMWCVRCRVRCPARAGKGLFDETAICWYTC